MGDDEWLNAAAIDQVKEKQQTFLINNLRVFGDFPILCLVFFTTFEGCPVPIR